MIHICVPFSSLESALLAGEQWAINSGESVKVGKINGKAYVIYAKA